jgi:hypothetical protein
MLEIVDVLTNPNEPNPPPFASDFNQYTCFDDCVPDPGYLMEQSDVTSKLLPDFATGSTRGFYIYSHGGPVSLSDFKNDVRLNLLDVVRTLRNPVSSSGIFNGLMPTPETPFRFVFLDGCDSAQGCTQYSANTWCQAFGIFPASAFVSLFLGDQQAFMGWGCPIVDFTGVQWSEDVVDDIASAYLKTVKQFFRYYAEGESVAKAFIDASKWAESNNAMPFPYWPSPSAGTITFENLTVTNVGIGPLYIVGNSGLTVSATDANWRGLFSPPPEPVPPQLP